VSDPWLGPLDPFAQWFGVLLGGAMGLAAGALLGLGVVGAPVVGYAGMAAALSATILSGRLNTSLGRLPLDRFVRWAPPVAALTLTTPIGWPRAWTPILVLVAAALLLIGQGVAGVIRVGARLLSGAAFAGLAVGPGDVLVLSALMAGAAVVASADIRDFYQHQPIARRRPR
jgi:hypothetical protein